MTRRHIPARRDGTAWRAVDCDRYDSVNTPSVPEAPHAIILHHGAGGTSC
jgi:hypothetical protein